MLIAVAGAVSAMKDDVLSALNFCPWTHQISKLMKATPFGSDRFIHHWCERHEIPIEHFEAPFNLMEGFGMLQRSKEILDHADGLLAIFDGKDRHTLDAIEYAISRRIQTVVYRFEDKGFDYLLEPRFGYSY